MDFFMVIFFVFESAIGLASTLYLVISLIAVLGYKVYRKCRHGISLYS